MVDDGYVTSDRENGIGGEVGWVKEEDNERTLVAMEGG